MEQMEMHDYSVADGEIVTVKLDELPRGESKPDFKFIANLNGETLSTNKNEFEFTASHKEKVHKLLMEFYPITSENVNLKILLTGSAGGIFNIPIEISEGEAQRRYFRFQVKGRDSLFGEDEGSRGW